MRGRRVLAAGLAMLALWVVGGALGAAVSAVGTGLGGSLPSGGAVPGGTVVVQAGDSLWAVAERTAPGQDPRSVVARLRALNDLPGGQVQAGQLLVLPAA